LRIFLAVDIEAPAVVERIVSIQRELAATGADLKPVEPQNLHFTVKFLGELAEPQLRDLIRRLDGLTAPMVTAELRGVGVFPSLSRISVIWVGVDPQASTVLERLSREVDRRLAGLAPPERRPFKAHLTICRVKSGRNRAQLAEAVRRLGDVEVGSAPLTALKVKQSTLTPKGPIYADLHTIPFTSP
jgi:2'-5' RNA ligase